MGASALEGAGLESAFHGDLPGWFVRAGNGPRLKRPAILVKPKPQVNFQPAANEQRKIKGKKFFKELVLIKPNGASRRCGEVLAGPGGLDLQRRIRLSASGVLGVVSRCNTCAGITVLPTAGFSRGLRSGFYPAPSYLYPQPSRINLGKLET